jgi:hypothetical protein
MSGSTPGPSVLELTPRNAQASLRETVRPVRHSWAGCENGVLAAKLSGTGRAALASPGLLGTSLFCNSKPSATRYHHAMQGVLQGVQQASFLLFCSGPRDRGGASALFEPRLLRAPDQTWATFPSPRLIASARAPRFPGIGGLEVLATTSKNSECKRTETKWCLESNHGLGHGVATIADPRRHARKDAHRRSLPSESTFSP